MKQRAIFLDRDGTLVHPRHYPSRPRDLVLYRGLGPGLRQLREAGFRLVVITNQSGIARGYFTDRELTAMHAHLARQLALQGVALDAVYYCPHHPDGVIPELAVRCACRKPEPGMLLRAASDLDLELRQSWLVGDILDDVEAGNRTGCRTILMDQGSERPPERPARQPAFVAENTAHALGIILAEERLGPPVNLRYLPASWRAPAPNVAGGIR